MGKSLQVKVKVSTLISALEKALSEREKRYKEQEAEQAKYEKEVEAYNLSVLKLIKAGKGKVTEASRSHYFEHRRNNKEAVFSVTVTLPKGLLGDEPQAPEAYQDWRWKNDREEITQAIRVLKMTEQEFVSASTYKSISQYL